MKKVLTAVLCLALVACLFGCKSTTEGADTTSAKESSSAKQPEIVDENLLDVTITIPASMFSQAAPASAELTQKQKDDGFKTAVVNADGSVTYTITKSAFNQFKTEMKKSVTDTINALPNDYTSIKAVETNDDFSVITIKVDKAAYESGFDSMSVMLVGVQANMYQAYTGGTAKSTITVADNATGEVINTTVYPLAN